MTQSTRPILILFLIILIGNERAVSLTDNTGDGDVRRSKSTTTTPLLWNFKNKIYYLGTTFKANFFEAELFCSYHGMRLVSILSEEENEFLGEKVYELGLTGPFWTSGTKLPDEEHWVWLTTGTRFGFTKWAPREPNNHLNLERCLNVNAFKIAEKKYLAWNDQNCVAKHFFICELSRPKNILQLIFSQTKKTKFRPEVIVQEA